MRSSTDGKVTRLTDKSAETQIFVKWFFRILLAWIALGLCAVLFGVLYEMFTGA